MRTARVAMQQIRASDTRFDSSYYVGRIDMSHWVGLHDSAHVPLRDLLSELREGARLPSAEAGIPIVRLENIRPCELSLDRLSTVEHNAGVWPKLRPGDVVFARAADPFRAAVVPGSVPPECTVSPEIALLRPRPALVPEYLAALLCSRFYGHVIGDMAYRRSRSSLTRVSLRDLANLPILLPSRRIQEEIQELYRTALDLGQKAQTEIHSVTKAISCEIGSRIPAVPQQGKAWTVRKASLSDRWDVSQARARSYLESLSESPFMKPLFELSRATRSTLQGLSETESVLSVQARDINAETFLVENATTTPLVELSGRMRQPLQNGDVIVCTTGAGEQIAYVDRSLFSEDLRMLGSATFTALHFEQTARYFAVALAHPVVARQLDLLASGSVQRFLNKRELDKLLVPCLGEVWREDFESRLRRAFERRHEAVQARRQLSQITEQFLLGSLKP